MMTSNTSPLLKIYEKAASLDRIGIIMLRVALVVVLVWIGALKFADYEADSIVPLVANSPLMSAVYAHPAPQYRQYMNKEGEVVASHHAWHLTNRTYPFSYALGCVIMLIGLLIALHKPFPQVAAIGSALLVLMACSTLSFLVTTPEAWVPALGSATHGFPFLAGAGRMIIKDSIMLSGAVITMADSAKSYLRRKESRLLRFEVAA